MADLPQIREIREDFSHLNAVLRQRAETIVALHKLANQSRLRQANAEANPPDAADAMANQAEPPIPHSILHVIQHPDLLRKTDEDEKIIPFNSRRNIPFETSNSFVEPVSVPRLTITPVRFGIGLLIPGLLITGIAWYHFYGDKVPNGFESLARLLKWGRLLAEFLETLVH